MVGRLKKEDDSGKSMRIRLFGFLTLLVVTMVLGVSITLLLTGSITADDEAEQFLQKELSHITHNLTVQCGDTSVQLVLLSEALTKSIEHEMSGRQLEMGELQRRPELLEELIGNELSRLQLALEKTKCSGVFMVLDATVNPYLENAENSRAGLYIRNCEPNVVGPDTTRLFLRGFPGIALQNGLSLQSKWDMEFDVEGRSFYHLPIERHRSTGLPLSRLYYWSFEGAIPDSDGGVILCSIPLIDSNGNAFGVCGFEISALNFRLNYAPDNSVYKHITCMLSLSCEDGLDAGNALFSGSPVELYGKRGKGVLRYAGDRGLNLYTPENGEALVGLHEQIKLYPGDSAFQDQCFTVATLIPKEELDAATLRFGLRFVLICGLLLALGVGVSALISKKYLSPIMNAIDAVQPDSVDASKTNILEIDRLLEKIKAMRADESPLSDNLFEDFIGRIKTLTPTEMIIFRYYLEGKTAAEVVSLMFISKSTLKTHNGHIYSKLGVSSKDELMLYVEMIKKSGRLSEIV